MREEGHIYLHHDETSITEMQVHLMRCFNLWLTTVRNSGNGYPVDWEPSDIDIIKSRLFWRIRAGFLPLPWAPPRAYSCPWYEVVEDMGNHACFEAHRLADTDSVFWKSNTWLIAQCEYDHISSESPDEHVVGFGEYRFKLFKDHALEAKRLGALNPHNPNLETEYLAREISAREGWFLRRLPELEIPPPVSVIKGWAQSLQPSMSTPIS